MASTVLGPLLPPLKDQKEGWLVSHERIPPLPVPGPAPVVLRPVLLAAAPFVTLLGGGLSCSVGVGVCLVDAKAPAAILMSGGALCRVTGTVGGSGCCKISASIAAGAAAVGTVDEDCARRAAGGAWWADAGAGDAACTGAGCTGNGGIDAVRTGAGDGGCKREVSASSNPCCR
mmetsp:Transcript_39821/g.110712  ORF Transcript_39821/g.110712 Transcript_39821/m.110712 type:complete len:174 (+) Transcript_39821:498-1019(+)